MEASFGAHLVEDLMNDYTLDEYPELKKFDE